MTRASCGFYQESRGGHRWSHLSRNVLTLINTLIRLKVMNTIAVVTGATRNLGFALAAGLARRLQPGDVVYLTGRGTNRVTESLQRICGAVAEVRGEVLDVSDRQAVEKLAAM